jgi:hypothetical protein
MKTLFRSVRPWKLVKDHCFFLTKGLVSGVIDRKARLKPYVFTFIMKNLKF